MQNSFIENAKKMSDKLDKMENIENININSWKTFGGKYWRESLFVDCKTDEYNFNILSVTSTSQLYGVIKKYKEHYYYHILPKIIGNNSLIEHERKFNNDEKVRNENINKLVQENLTLNQIYGQFRACEFLYEELLKEEISNYERRSWDLEE
jgi:hypothetical protein